MLVSFPIIFLLGRSLSPGIVIAKFCRLGCTHIALSPQQSACQSKVNAIVRNRHARTLNRTNWYSVRTTFAITANAVILESKGPSIIYHVVYTTKVRHTYSYFFVIRDESGLWLFTILKAGARDKDRLFVLLARYLIARNTVKRCFLNCGILLIGQFSEISQGRRAPTVS